MRGVRHADRRGRAPDGVRAGPQRVGGTDDATQSSIEQLLEWVRTPLLRQVPRHGHRQRRRDQARAAQGAGAGGARRRSRSGRCRACRTPATASASTACREPARACGSSSRAATRRYPIWTGCFWADNELPDNGERGASRSGRPRSSRVRIDDDNGRSSLIETDGGSKVELASDVDHRERRRDAHRRHERRRRARRGAEGRGRPAGVQRQQRRAGGDLMAGQGSPSRDAAVPARRHGADRRPPTCRGEARTARSWRRRPTPSRSSAARSSSGHAADPEPVRAGAVARSPTCRSRSGSGSTLSQPARRPLPGSAGSAAGPGQRSPARRRRSARSERRCTSIRHPLAIDAASAGSRRRPTTRRHVDQLMRQVLLTDPGERSTGPTSAAASRAWCSRRTARSPRASRR